MRLRPDRPFNPASFPVYYGWILLPIAVMGVLMSMPGQTAGFSAFTESILAFTGFTRTQLSLYYMIGTISSGFILPLMGKLLDRWGSRNMIIFASVMLGITLFWLSWMDRIASLFPMVSSGVTYTILMVIGIFCLRFFGQGLLPMSSNTMVGKWFDRKRGRAVAIMGVVNTLAFSATPAVMAALVSALAWNGAWRLLAGITGIGMALIGWAFFRDTPEACGLQVDGETLEHLDGENKKAEITGATVSDAIRFRTFWAIMLVLGTGSLVITGITFHIQAIGVQAGMTLQKAVAIFIPVSFIAIPVSFISAMLTERIHVRILVSLMAFSQLLAYLSISMLHTSYGYILTIIGLGFSNGLTGTIQTAVVAKIFGRKYLGSINGVVISVMVIGSAIGPVFISAVNDIVGSLRTGVTIMGILPVISLILSYKMPEHIDHASA